MRFIKAVPPLRAGGLVGEVYRDVRRDFGVLRDPKGNSPWLAHSPHPELLAGFWMTAYETVLVEGTLDRVEKEAIATAVSTLNECSFCIDAHSFLGTVARGSAGGNRANRSDGADGPDGGESPGRRAGPLTAWAAATRDPTSTMLTQPPFTATEAPEAIGTAIAFHYVNRVVHFFQGDGGLDLGPAALRAVTTPVLTRVVGRAVRRNHLPGRSLRLLPNTELPQDLAWAAPSPSVAAAMARFAAAIERAGWEVLSDDQRDQLTAALASWDGNDPPLDLAWLDEAVHDLDRPLRPAARIANIAAFAPQRIDEASVQELRRLHPSDRALVAVVAWSAFQTARRIASWLTADLTDRGEPLIS